MWASASLLSKWQQVGLWLGQYTVRRTRTRTRTLTLTRTRTLTLTLTPQPLTDTNPNPNPDPAAHQVRCLTHAESYVCRV